MTVVLQRNLRCCVNSTSLSLTHSSVVAILLSRFCTEHMSTTSPPVWTLSDSGDTLTTGRGITVKETLTVTLTPSCGMLATTTRDPSNGHNTNITHVLTIRECYRCYKLHVHHLTYCNHLIFFCFGP